jgi:hypothetical protein
MTDTADVSRPEITKVTDSENHSIEDGGTTPNSTLIFFGKAQPLTLLQLQDDFLPVAGATTMVGPDGLWKMKHENVQEGEHPFQVTHDDMQSNFWTVNVDEEGS